jgi:hypothetical protein
MYISIYRIAFKRSNNYFHINKNDTGYPGKKRPTGHAHMLGSLAALSSGLARQKKRNKNASIELASNHHLLTCVIIIEQLKQWILTFL